MQKLWPSCRLVGVARSNCLPVLLVRMPAALCRCCSLSPAVRGQLVIRCVSIHLVASVNHHRLLLCRALINRGTSVLRFWRWIRMLVIAKLEHVSDNRFVPWISFFFSDILFTKLCLQVSQSIDATLLLRKYEVREVREVDKKSVLYLWQYRCCTVLHVFTYDVISWEINPRIVKTTVSSINLLIIEYTAHERFP